MNSINHNNDNTISRPNTCAINEARPTYKRMHLAKGAQLMRAATSPMEEQSLPTVVFKTQPMRRAVTTRLVNHSSHDIVNHSSPLQNNNNKMQETDGWNVQNLPTFPFYFHMEKAHEYVDDESSVISKRISDCLNKFDDTFNVTYDDEKAIAYAEGKDSSKPNYCKMQIRLFQAIDSSSILVECQRRTGCCLAFHSMAMRILCAAKGCPEEIQEVCPHSSIGADILEKCRKTSLPVEFDETDNQEIDNQCTCGQYAFFSSQDNECSCIGTNQIVN